MPAMPVSPTRLDLTRVALVKDPQRFSGTIMVMVMVLVVMVRVEMVEMMVLVKNNNGDHFHGGDK